MNYFTHYWQNETWEINREYNQKGTLLGHISGNLFRKRGVEIGDTVYVVTVKKGKLFLCGKLIVGKFCNVDEVAKDLGVLPEELWQADEHIVASDATIHQWDLEVPANITEQLEFISGNETTHLKFKTKSKLDQQTLRGVRRLNLESAAMLDDLLGELKPFRNNSTKIDEIQLWTSESNDINDLESGIEGNKKQRFTTYYERLPESRKQAVKIHGVTCKACGFNFEKTYGELGKDFIHVHHIKPVSQFEQPKKINPATDLTVLCPNCHSIVHRYRNKTLSVEELKVLVKIHRAKS